MFHVTVGLGLLRLRPRPRPRPVGLVAGARAGVGSRRRSTDGTRRLSRLPLASCGSPHAVCSSHVLFLAQKLLLLA